MCHVMSLAIVDVGQATLLRITLCTASVPFAAAQVYKVDTAGDCYIVAGGLMIKDEDGLITLDTKPNAENGARSVMEFTKVCAAQHNTAQVPMQRTGHAA